MVRRKGDRGFTRVSWDEALDLVAERIRATTPERVGLYLTARGITNEVYYAAQKAARFIGTNNVDNAARVCHAPSTSALKESIGVAATTCSYRDVIESDLIVLFGADVANAQPVFMKYLYLAKQRGARRGGEPVPGARARALLGAVERRERAVRHEDRRRVLRDPHRRRCRVRERRAEGTARERRIDRDFVNEHTAGFDALLAELEDEPYDALEQASGATRADMARFARMYAAARSAVLVWSMGVTQHVSGVDNVRAIVNLGLARGNVGRPGAGLMPIRGHSGVQGGAEMGCYATAFPGGGPVNAESAADLSAQWGFTVPSTPGLTAAEMVDAARHGDLDVLWSSGGNFLDVLPAPDVTAVALARAAAHPPGHRPFAPDARRPGRGRGAAARGDALRAGGRRHVDHDRAPRRVQPRDPGPRVGEARSEWQIFADIARRVRPEQAARFGCESAEAIRAEIARVVPAYAGIENLHETGDAIQVGGARLCEGGVFPTPDRRGHFAVVTPSRPISRPATSCCRRGGESSSTPWSGTRRIR